MRQTLDTVWQELRRAARALRLAPGFTAAVVLTLGLGIGANAAMFGIVDRLMFRPHPYLRDPARVDRVYLYTSGWNGDRPYTVFPWTRQADLQRWTTRFAQHAAFAAGRHGVGTGAAAREHAVVGASGGYFAFFDARPARGRFLGAADDRLPAGADVAVVSWDYWNVELGAREDAIGERLQVGNATYTIVGVAPDGFTGIDDGEAPAAWVPLAAYAAHEGGASDGATFHRAYGWDFVQAMVRRRPGVTREAASADLTAAFARSWEASRVVHPQYAPAEVARPRAVAGPLRTAAGPARGLEARTLAWTSGVAVVVFLIACANVANLLLARAIARRRDVALRLALGVTRGRLAAQAFAESLLLAALGTAAGLAIAQWGGAATRALVAGSASGLDVVGDRRTVLAAALVALVGALATAVAPVLFARRQSLADVLRTGARGGSYRRSPARTALLVAQGALTFVLLVGATLFTRSLGHVRALRLGYDVEPLLSVRLEPRDTPLDGPQGDGVREGLLRAARARPDVVDAAWVSNAPFGSGTSTMALAVPGVDSAGALGRFTVQVVTPGYFSTVQTAIVRGRALADADAAGAARVAVVSATMARRLWPGQDPLGRCLQLAMRSARPDTLPCTTVVGVAEDAVHDPAADLPMRYYLPEAQMQFGSRWLLLRMRREPAAAAEEVRRTLQAVLPGSALVTVRPARELLDGKRRSWLLGATMFGAFAGLALVVAAVGLYAVIAHDVAQRLHELGVRVALGARDRHVAGLVARRGATDAAAGLAIGSAIALAAARWVEPLLFRQEARDPLVFAGVGAAMLVVAMAACAVPARRATRVDPNVVLRGE